MRQHGSLHKLYLLFVYFCVWPYAALRLAAFYFYQGAYMNLVLSACDCTIPDVTEYAKDYGSMGGEKCVLLVLGTHL